MDDQTLENLQTLGVELPVKGPTVVPAPTPEEVKKVVDDANKQIPPPEIGNDEGAKPDIPDTTPVVDQPETPTEPAAVPEVEPKSEPEEPKEEITDAENLDDVLKTLQDLSQESLNDIAKDTSPNDKKIKKVTVPDAGLTKDQNKTIQEIVDLNVKLQNELSVSKIREAAKDQKIKELAEQNNAFELDDSKEEVVGEIKGINKYMKQYKSSNNEVFKVKATQEALDFLEQVWGVPLQGDYLGDRITEQLKAVERISAKSADDVEREGNPEPDDPAMDYIKAHGIGL